MGDNCGTFYTDYGQVSLMGGIWVQYILGETLNLFEWCGLEINSVQKKSIVCTPVFMWVLHMKAS